MAYYVSDSEDISAVHNCINDKTYIASKPVRLIVNADDLGYCVVRDRGIAECFLHGIVTSTSLLVNGHSAVHAIEIGRMYGMPLGIHINLTEGRPISDRHYQTLTNDENLFWDKFEFRKLLANGKISLNEVGQLLSRTSLQFH